MGATSSECDEYKLAVRWPSPRSPSDFRGGPGNSQGGKPEPPANLKLTIQRPTPFVILKSFLPRFLVTRSRLSPLLPNQDIWKLFID